MQGETFFVQVPDNEAGILGFLKGDMTQVETFVFTEAETRFLMALYDRFNERFGKDIDFYETEHLGQEVLADTLEMTLEFAAANQTSRFLPSIRKFQRAVELAIRNNVWLVFDF
ncbi:MAG: hypothetical protein MJ025_03630 [Victivallaceae bacterium]|nr:hypothetical protein [Victivallaceae bacterium]